MRKVEIATSNITPIQPLHASLTFALRTLGSLISCSLFSRNSPPTNLLARRPGSTAFASNYLRPETPLCRSTQGHPSPTLPILPFHRVDPDEHRAPNVVLMGNQDSWRRWEMFRNQADAFDSTDPIRYSTFYCSTLPPYLITCSSCFV